MLKPLFTTFCAAAMFAAQPTFADKSQDILGSWDCEVAIGSAVGTTQFTFFVDGTGYNNWDTISHGRLGETHSIVDSEMTWHITDGILYHDHTNTHRHKLVFNGNDHTHSALGQGLADFAKHSDGDPLVITNLTDDTLELTKPTRTGRVLCSRLLNS